MRHLNRLTLFLETKGFWWGVALLGTSLFVAALYWQYALNEEPCQVCIQARLWVVAIALLGVLMSLLPHSRRLYIAGNSLLLLCAVGLGERSFYLYEIENFRGDGSCEFSLGMPDWFAVDRWLPSLFEVRNICSYTPEIAFGVSMAEALMSISLIVASLCGANILRSATDQLSPL
jgi:disulfide bond formation protein DsbB